MKQFQDNWHICPCYRNWENLYFFSELLVYVCSEGFAFAKLVMYFVPIIVDPINAKPREYHNYIVLSPLSLIVLMSVLPMTVIVSRSHELSPHDPLSLAQRCKAASNVSAFECERSCIARAFSIQFSCHQSFDADFAASSYLYI